MDELEVDFDWSLDPDALRTIYKQTNFEAKFVATIANDVILLLSPQHSSEPHNPIYNEVLVQQRLIDPLERFICGSDNVEKVLESIKQLNKQSKMCRRILKSGDVTFSCKDCALDTTCVVCIDCFHKSAHKDHNYRMSNSEGGGCCDCGDVEAWKQNYACTDHSAIDQANISLCDYENKELRSKQIEEDRRNVTEIINRLPKDIATRYFLMCQASLHYAFMVLSITEDHLLPPPLDVYKNVDPQTELGDLLSMSQTKKNCFTVVYNDEVHTYDHVISNLVKIIKCSKMTASIIASTISREGRCLVVNDTLATCNEYSSKISSIRDANQGPLKVSCMHGKILAHQEFALRLVEWIRKISSRSDAFRILTAITLLGQGDLSDDILEHSETLVERIALANTKLWKVARVQWNDLFVTTLLTDYCIKQRFARLLTRRYGQLMKDFIIDDHDHSVSILTMTTQIYTVPSLTCLLVEEENALSIILGTFVDVCKNAKRDNPNISFENRHTFDMNQLRRAFYGIYDFKYLINLEPTIWTVELRKSVIDSVRLFLELLELLQGVDSVKRQLGQHLEYEPDWESGMSLQGKLITLISRFVQFCSYDEQVLAESISETLAKLAKNGRFKMINKELFRHSANCINYDVTTMPVSIHLPLTRFAGALIVMLMLRRPCEEIPYKETLVLNPYGGQRADGTKLIMKQQLSMIDIMEPSLRAEVMIAQFRSGMWRRNGYSLINQIINFQSPIMRKEMFDRDVLVLQECAAMCEPNEFLIHLINKFNLFTWLTSEYVRDPCALSNKNSHTNDEEILNQTMSLGEEFLQLLLTIIGERYTVGIGMVEEEEIMKNEIIQLLCVSPMTRSDITQKLQVNDHELDCIKAVAHLKRSTSNSTGKYELREEFYERFNPFFYHYTRRLQSNALDAQLKRKKNLPDQLICCPPPKPVELTKQFCNLNELLKCDILLLLIERILTRCLNVAFEGSGSSSSHMAKIMALKFNASELQLDQTLHLIGLGLYEQERNPSSFKFIEAAHSKGIFTLIKDNYEKGERNKDLLMWLMRKTVTLVDKIAQDPNNVEIKEIFKFALKLPDAANQESKKRNSEIAAQRRDRIMAMMKANQDKFLSSQTTKQLIAETEKHELPKQGSSEVEHGASTSAPSASTSTTGSGPNSSSGNTSSMLLANSVRQRKTKPPKSVMGFASSSKMNKCMDEQQPRQTPSLQSNMELDNQSNEAKEQPEEQELEDEDEEAESERLVVPSDESQMCILCRDEQKITFEGQTMVLLAYIQRSAVLSRNRSERRIPNYALVPSNNPRHTMRNAYLTSKCQRDSFSFTSDSSYSFDATFMPADLFFSPHISTCGHVMHYDCWRAHTESVVKRESNRLNRSARHVSFEPEKHEILCPLCECISNATIPLLPNYTRFAARKTKVGGCGPESIFNLSPGVIDSKTPERLSAFLKALRSAVDMFKQLRHIKPEVSQPVSNHQNEHQKGPPSLVAATANYADFLPMDKTRHVNLQQPRQLNDVLEELDEMGALGLRDFLSSVRNNKISSSLCSKSLLDSMKKLSERIHLIGLDLDRYTQCDAPISRTFLMTSWTVAYTLQTYERLARFKGTSIFDDLNSSAKTLGLSSLLRFAFGSMMVHQSDVMQSLLINKLRYLLISKEHMSYSLCCLDIDAFETLVSLLITLPRLYSHTEDLSEGSHQNQRQEHRGASIPADKTPRSRSAYISSVGELLLGMSSTISSGRGMGTSDNYTSWITQALDTEYSRNLIHLMLLLNLVQVCMSLQTDLMAKRRTNDKLKKGRQRDDKPLGQNHEEEMEVEQEESEQQRKESELEDAIDEMDRDENSRGWSESMSQECFVLQGFYQDCILASGHPNAKLPKVNERFCSRIKARLLPFLRSTSLLMFHLSNILPAETLRRNSAFREAPSGGEQSASSRKYEDGRDELEMDKFEQQVDWNCSDEEFDSLCQYLDLPNKFSVLLHSQEACHLARSWLRHSRVLILIKSATSSCFEWSASKACDSRSFVDVELEAEAEDEDDDDDEDHSSSKEHKPNKHEHQISNQQQYLPTTYTSELPLKFIWQPHLVARLIELPYDYSELVDKVSDFSCPSIKNEDSRTPTMCLVCGVMLCSHSYCCQRDLNDLGSVSVQREPSYQRQLLLDSIRRASSSSHSSSSTGGAGGAGSSGADPAQAPTHLWSHGAGNAALALISNTGSGIMNAFSGAPFVSPLPTYFNLGQQMTLAHRNSTAPNQQQSAGAAGQPGDQHQHPHPHQNPNQLRSPLVVATHHQQQLVGRCTYHAYECSGGVGAFLRIRNCQILLLSGRSKGCYLPAPYIDDHGETDYGLLRGNPLHLNREHYRKLEQMWLTHSIPEQVSRNLEYSPYFSSINWHLH